jgi:hypothetical protein
MRKKEGSAFLAPLFLLAACSAQATAPAAPPLESSLTVVWQIDGKTDMTQCTQAGISAIHVVVTRANGDPAGTFDEACATFGANITLDQGSYSAVATLVDVDGTPRTSDEPIQPFTLNGNDEVRVLVDFPTASFE